MKKWISFLLCLLMVSSCITISATAIQAEPTVALSSAQGSAGDTVTVTATVANNPGIVSMYLELEYDRSRLELVSATDCGLLAGKTFSKTVTTYPYALTWDDSLADGNNTSNGDLVILTFKILDDAPYGRATVTLKNANGILDFNLDPVDFTFVSGTVTVEEGVVGPSGGVVVSASKITSADMVLGQDITVNYYVSLDATHLGAMMRFTMNGVETVVGGEETEVPGIYRYAFQKIAPQCMGDNIRAELIFDGEVVAVKEEYSVKTYCQNMLAKSAEQLRMSDEKYEALRTLIADTLEYGARAQLYVGYKTNALVNEGITEQSEFVELNPDDCDEIIEKGNNFTLTGVKFVSAGVYFDYYNALYVKFNAPDLTDSNFRIRLKDGDENIIATYKLSDCQLVSAENSTYLLILPALYATQFEDFYWIELCKYTSRATTVQWSMNYGVSSYVCAKQNKTDADGNLTPMAELARATYNYGLSAVAYKDIAN